MITTPSYPNKYQRYTDCVYTISQPKGNVIEVIFLHMEVSGYYGDGDCLIIRDGNSEIAPLIGEFWDEDTTPVTIRSTRNTIWMR